MPGKYFFVVCVLWIGVLVRPVVWGLALFSLNGVNLRREWHIAARNSMVCWQAFERISEAVTEQKHVDVDSASSDANKGSKITEDLDFLLFVRSRIFVVDDEYKKQQMF